MIFHLKRATSKLDKQNRKIFKKSFFLQRIFDNSVKNSDEKENDFKRKALTCFFLCRHKKGLPYFRQSDSDYFFVIFMTGLSLESLLMTTLIFFPLGVTKVAWKLSS